MSINDYFSFFNMALAIILSNVFNLDDTFIIAFLFVSYTAFLWVAYSVWKKQRVLYYNELSKPLHLIQFGLTGSFGVYVFNVGLNNLLDAGPSWLNYLMDYAFLVIAFGMFSRVFFSIIIKSWKYAEETKQ